MSSFSIGSGILDLLADDTRLMESLRRVESTMQRFQRRMNQIGAAARNALIIGGGALAGSVMQAAKFESQLAKIQTEMGANTAWMEKFKVGLRDLSVTFGISTADLAASMYRILSAGYAPADALKILAISARAARAGFAELGESADAITNLMMAYKIPVDQAANVSDMLFTAVRNGKVDFGELASSLARIGPLAAETGIGLDQLLSMVTSITRTGVPARDAVVQLTGFIKAFIKPSKNAREEAAKFGIDLQASSLYGDNLIATLQKLKGLGPTGLARIFPDIRGTRGILSLLSNIDAVKEGIKNMDKASGATASSFENVRHTMQFQWDQIKQAAIAVAVTLGEVVVPMIASYANRLRDNLPAIRDWIESHAEGIRTAIRWTASILVAAYAIPKLISFLRLGAFAVQGLIMVLRYASTAIIAAFANPLVTVAVAAVALFTATVIRSQIANESWTQSAYAMSRAMGLFHNATQDYASAMEEAGNASHDVMLAQAGLNKAMSEHQDMRNQIDAANDVVAAQQRRVEALKAAQKAYKESGETTTLGDLLGISGEQVPEVADKQIEDEVTKLRKYQDQLEELQKARANASIGPSPKMPDMPAFAIKPPDEDVESALKKKQGPTMEGVASMFDTLQKSVYGTGGDPIENNTKETQTNTAAVKDNSAAIKMLAQAFKENPKTAAIIGS